MIDDDDESTEAGRENAAFDWMCATHQPRPRLNKPFAIHEGAIDPNVVDSLVEKRWLKKLREDGGYSITSRGITEMRRRGRGLERPARGL